MLYLFQRVIRNRWKYYKLGQNYYKSGQLQLLQIGAIVIRNWGKIITNWGSYYEMGQNYYKLGQMLQIGAITITPCRTCTML